MFGLNDDNQKSNDDPAMLDNVKQLASEPASQVEPQQQSGAPAPAADSQTTTPPPQTFTPTTPPAEPTSSTDNAPTNISETTPAPEQNVTADASSSPEESDTQTGHPEPAEGFSSQPMPTPVTPDASLTETPSNGSSPAELFGNQSAASDTTTDNDSSNAIDTSGLPVIQSTSAPAEPTQNDVTAPPAPTPQTAEGSSDAPEPTESVNHDQLASIKQEALGHLEGLSDHLGDNPEEVFKSTMQLIQANDNHTLLEKALQAAKDIKDDKVRAKAMLDIVNEINYFSQDK